MHHFRQALLFAVVACTCLALTGCGDDTEPADQKYRQAIEAVPNVDHAEVQQKSDPGMGSTTSIEVFTDTNDGQVLKHVLHKTIQAYLAETDDGENSSLHFVVVSEDKLTLLAPDAVGVTGNDLRSLREQYEAP